MVARLKQASILSGSLGSTAQMLQSMVLGTVHATVSVVLSSYIPNSGVFLLPFLFKDQAHFDRVTKDDKLVDEVLGAGPKKGLRVLSIWDSGFREIWTRNKEIRSLADLTGLKLRVPEAKIWVDTFKAFNVNATPMSYARSLLRDAAGGDRRIEATRSPTITRTNFLRSASIWPRSTIWPDLRS